MDDIVIRPFRYDDIDGLVQIAEVSIADEMRAQGITTEGFISQVRMVARGRMVPFRVMSALAGIKWGLLVAEVDGRVVGCGGYIGQKNIELANLMVTPAYRRQGIGQKLLEARLQHLSEQGYKQVTTTVLADNEASLGNLRKQGFEVFDEYIVFKHPIPLPQAKDNLTNSGTSRPISKTDKSVFESIEAQIVDPRALKVLGSSWSDYVSTTIEGVLNRFSGGQQWSRIFEKEGKVIGFIRASSSRNYGTGFVSRPVVPNEHLSSFPLMLNVAEYWLTEIGKSAVQITIPAGRPQLVGYFQNSEWNFTFKWLRLVKEL